MLHINQLVCPTDLSEAYRAFTENPGSVVLGGCGYLRLASRTIETAIDLAGLGLDFVRRENGKVEIGAMTSLRTVETHPDTSSLWNGMLSDSVRNIVGVQLRNSVTLGGTVAGRYHFSDPITALVALEARVVLHHHGQMELAEFLETKGLKDIVVKVVLPDDDRTGAFISIRKSATDYAVLNCAVARIGSEYRVVVGSRPGRAMRVPKAEEWLNEHGANHQGVVQAAPLWAESIPFGDNPRASGRYRKTICPILIRRALSEVTDAA